MASVIKPRSLPPGVSLQKIEEFNWEDVLSKARGHLEQVRQQAQVIIEEAKKNAEVIRQTAREEGKKAAQNDLTAMAQQQASTIAEERVNTSFKSLESLTEQLEDVTEQWLRQWQHETIPLAIVIAERLVRRQIDIDPSILLQWIADGVNLARAEQNLQIRIHPNDRQLLGPRLDTFVSKIGQKQKIDLVEDDSVQSPGVVLSSDDLEIDAQLVSQLDRIVEEMR